MDIGVTISKVRKEYKEYLRETHPDWADTTISTHVSDAFYLYQNTIALSFWKCFESDAAMEKAKGEILDYLKQEVMSDRADERTAQYYRDLKRLKEFIDSKGGVKTYIGYEYDCEVIVYKYAKMVYDGTMEMDAAVKAMCQDVPCYGETSHMMIERVKQSKSLVDVMLIARTCQEHYKNNVDSFILVSSDSDYWGLISSLPEARFLVMIERENCGPDLKNALLNAGIFYCYIDDFYSGNAEDIKLGALFKEMERYIDQTVRLNINEMFSAALKATRIEMSSSEKKQFIAKYLKTMQMEITDDGDVVLQLKRK